MKAESFREIEEEFNNRVNRIVWCTVATVDAKCRPRSRILHPIWEGSTGWIATGRHSPKAEQLDQNAFVSLSYWDQRHEQVYAECRFAWEQDAGEKQRIWQLFGDAPPPMGYDLGAFWKDPGDEDYGLIKLDPWRVELFSLDDLFNGREPRVWMP